MLRYRVCLVCGDFFPDPIGGQGIYTYELARNLVKHGHDVTVITTKRSGLRNREFKILPVHSSNLLMFAIEAWFRYRKLIASFDIVHGNDFYHLCFLLFRRQWAAITTIHNTHLQRYRAGVIRSSFVSRVAMLLEKYVCLRSHRIIAVSETTRRALLEYGLDESRVGVIHNGVDIARFTPIRRGGFRSTVGLTNTDKVVLFVGRLVQRKRPLELLVAFHRLCVRDPTVHLLIVGRGPLQPILHNYVKEHGLERNVHDLGFIDNEQLPNIYADSDLFVLVSSGEGLPLSALEALASGCKLVLSYDATGGASLLRESNRVVEYQVGTDSLEDKILEALKLDDVVVDRDAISIETCVRRVIDLYGGVTANG